MLKHIQRNMITSEVAQTLASTMPPGTPTGWIMTIRTSELFLSSCQTTNLYLHFQHWQLVSRQSDKESVKCQPFIMKLLQSRGHSHSWWMPSSPSFCSPGYPGCTSRCKHWRYCYESPWLSIADILFRVLPHSFLGITCPWSGYSLAHNTHSTLMESSRWQTMVYDLRDMNIPWTFIQNPCGHGFLTTLPPGFLLQ
jgi:hypothetical protein